MHYQPKHDLLKQRIILVTGAGDGIGRQAALTYARYGAKLILLGRTESKLRDVQQQIQAAGGINATYYVLDLLTAPLTAYTDFSRWLTANTQHLDGVLHNAGLLGEIAPIIEQPIEVWQSVMQVNVNSTFILTQKVLPLLLKSTSSSMIFTSSSVGRKGRANWGAYAVSKFATEGLMQVLADEYQDSPLRVNCINPGGTRTAMRAAAFPNEDANKLRTAEDIMPLYLYMMGEDSADKNGMSLDAQPNRIAGEAK